MLILLPDVWLMPLECLHMTALEITHSLTEQEIETFVEKLRPNIRAVSFLSPFKYSPMRLCVRSLSRIPLACNSRSALEYKVGWDNL